MCEDSGGHQRVYHILSSQVGGNQIKTFGNLAQYVMETHHLFDLSVSTVHNTRREIHESTRG